MVHAVKHFIHAGTGLVLDAYTVRTHVSACSMHAYGYTFIARYAHDSTVTVRGSSVHLAVAMAFAPPASKHALPLIEDSPTPRHHRHRATWANQMGLMGHVASVRKHRTIDSAGSRRMLPIVELAIRAACPRGTIAESCTYVTVGISSSLCS